MKRGLVMVAVLVAMLVLSASSSAADRSVISRFILSEYDPRGLISIEARLVNSSTDVTLKFDGTGYVIEFSGGQVACQPVTLALDDMTVLADALQYAVATAQAMPEWSD